MFEIHNFTLIADNDSCTYYAGDLVTGKCHIGLSGTLNFNYIEIKLIGLAEVNWFDNQTDGMAFRSEHPCIRMLYQCQQNGNPQFISDGEYVIPFVFELPVSGIPSSFEGKFGHIRYFLEAAICRRDSQLSDHQVIIPITIFRNLELANHEYLCTPNMYSAEKTFGNWLFKKGYIRLKAIIEDDQNGKKSSLKMSCITENRTNFRITPKATVMQKIIYFGRGKSRRHSAAKHRTENNSLSTVRGLAVGPKMTRNQSLTLSIEKQMPILGNDCPIIKSYYLISLSLDCPDMVFDLKIELKLNLN